eukprot:55335-Prymnesium_polylepis.1
MVLHCVLTTPASPPRTPSDRTRDSRTAPLTIPFGPHATTDRESPLAGSPWSAATPQVTLTSNGYFAVASSIRLATCLTGVGLDSATLTCPDGSAVVMNGGKCSGAAAGPAPCGMMKCRADVRNVA